MFDTGITQKLIYRKIKLYVGYGLKTYQGLSTDTSTPDKD